MTSTDLHEFKIHLLEQKSAILNKTNEFLNEQSLEKNHIPDESELISSDLSNNVSIHLHERDRLTLLEIEKTLAKVSTGTYGLCESCGCDIESKRLRARPLASLCIECKEEQEDPRNKLN